MPPSLDQTELVRSFNRFYTKKIGLLGEGLLDTRFSLTQARLLYELGNHPGVRSTDLIGELGLDAGYLSRLLKNFEKQALVKRAASTNDRRVNHLSLTGDGRKVFNRLNARSASEINTMLTPLDSSQRQLLMNSMASIRTLLAPQPKEGRTFAIRNHQPGDIGWVIARHGELYAQEYQFDSTFEGLVAEIAGRFLTHFNEQRERCWIAQSNGERLGSVFLVEQSKAIAKLRLLMVDPAARGMGIGKTLVNNCIEFARHCGYRKVTLWTNSILIPARKIYEQAGFKLVKEEPHHSFGQPLIGQSWELKL